jgi:mannose-1-phosphate guanylyltransferase
MTLILEPMARNTAPAIALAAVAALAEDRHAVLLVMPSDHVIADPAAFREAVARLRPGGRRRLAGDPWHLPRATDTGYGYIKRGAAIGTEVYAVERFVEKPDRATAEAYLAEGGYDWNGGIFLFPRRHLPGGARGLCTRNRRRCARRDRRRGTGGAADLPRSRSPSPPRLQIRSTMP